MRKILGCLVVVSKRLHIRNTTILFITKANPLFNMLFDNWQVSHWRSFRTRSDTFEQPLTGTGSRLELALNSFAASWREIKVVTSTLRRWLCSSWSQPADNFTRHCHNTAPRRFSRKIARHFVELSWVGLSTEARLCCGCHKGMFQYAHILSSHSTSHLRCMSSLLYVTWHRNFQLHSSIIATRSLSSTAMQSYSALPISRAKYNDSGWRATTQHRWPLILDSRNINMVRIIGYVGSTHWVPVPLRIEIYEMCGCGTSTWIHAVYTMPMYILHAIAYPFAVIWCHAGFILNSADYAPLSIFNSTTLYDGAPSWSYVSNYSDWLTSSDFQLDRHLSWHMNFRSHFILPHNVVWNIQSMLIRFKLQLREYSAICQIYKRKISALVGGVSTPQDLHFQK